MNNNVWRLLIKQNSLHCFLQFSRNLQSVYRAGKANYDFDCWWTVNYSILNPSVWASMQKFFFCNQQDFLTMTCRHILIRNFQAKLLMHHDRNSFINFLKTIGDIHTALINHCLIIAIDINITHPVTHVVSSPLFVPNLRAFDQLVP